MPDDWTRQIYPATLRKRDPLCAVTRWWSGGDLNRQCAMSPYPLAEGESECVLRCAGQRMAIVRAGKIGGGFVPIGVNTGVGGDWTLPANRALCVV